jgi:hypothetical protein
VVEAGSLRLKTSDLVRVTKARVADICSDDPLPGS